MKNKGTVEQQIKKLERSIEKFGDQPRKGQVFGPKRYAIIELQRVKK